MKLRSIKNIDELPSVLNGDQVSQRVMELIDIIKIDGVENLQGAEAINELIGYLGYGEELDETSSKKVLHWIKVTYDQDNLDLIYCNSCNAANLNCSEAAVYIKDRAVNGATKYERQQYREIADEIGIKT